MKALLALAVAASVPFWLASPAQAYVLRGKPWPTGTIRYVNEATDQAWAVARAADVWNRSGARVRFVAVRSRASADLVIRHFSTRGCADHAQATVGYSRPATMELPWLDEASAACNSYWSAQAVAHELGHVLGLGHEPRGCAAMNPSASWQRSGLCPKSDPWTWRCGLLEDDDVRGAIALYGGKPRPRGSTLCEVYRPIAAPAWLSATFQPERLAVVLRFPRPPAPAMPAFFGATARIEGSYAFDSAEGSCPADPAGARRYGWSVTIGKALEIVGRPRLAGRYCYSVWALDGYGRPSSRPVTAWVDVAAVAR